MLDYYTLEGTEYSKEEVLSAAEAKGLTIDSYIQQYYPEDFTGKQVDSTVDPTVSQENMGSQLDDGSLGSYELPQVDVTASQEEDTWIERTVGKNIVTDYFGDLWRAGEQGLAQGATVDEAFDVYKKGKDISDEELMRYIEVSDALDKTGASDEMREYEEIKNEAGGGVWGFMKGMVMTRGQVIPQVIVSSAAAMGRTFFDSEEAAAAAGGGAAIAGTAGSFVPIVGTATGAIGGAVAGLTGSMETALTLTELLKTELGEKDFNKENIRAILENEELFEDIKDRALARGATIGAVEGITVGLSRGIGAKLLAKGASKGKIARQVTGIETLGGSGGEALGQFAAGQEFDIAEVLMEGVAEAKGVVNVADILAKKEYKINGEKRTRKEVLDKVSNAKAENLAKIQFEVTGDKNLDNLIKEKQAEAVFETQIDERVGETDRKKLVELERKRQKAEADTKKKGIFAVPDAETALENVNTEISDIINKYEGVDVTDADVQARKKVAGEVRAEVAERVFQGNMAFAKKHSKLYGLKFTELTQEEVKKRFKNTENSDLINSLGGIIGDEIIINKDLAKTRVYGDNVGNHELLHGIIKASKANINQETINDFLNIIGEENKAKVQERIDKNYTPEYMAENLDEYFTIFSDAIANGEITFNDSMFTKIADVIRRMFAGIGLAKVDFESGRGAYNFLKDYNKSIHKGSLSSGVAKATKGDGTSEALKTSKAPEALIKTIKRGGNPRQIAAAEDALVPQYQALALEALGYTEAKGDILRKNVVSAVNDYYDAIVRNYDPKKGKFSTHVYNNIFPKNDTIFEKAKTLAKRDESVSMDAPEARQVAGDAGTTTNTEDTFVQKINILQDFAIADRVADKIKALVKVTKGDNFKSIISKYAGKAGALIFEIPAKKIMEGGANLAAVTKYTEGMPAPAEAQNIQRFFNAPNNSEKFIKTLPLYNVTDKTADINKIGENIEVSRDTYGYAIGLRGLPLNYFYENYTDPKALSKDPKVYEQRISSRAGRSLGLTSQTPMKRLKPQFRKPTPETVEQFKKDLGITPKNEANVYSRDIGQLLKGVAKVHSINAAISGAQRTQEAKTKAAPVTEQKAIKQQTADITAAQSKIAFSKSKTDKILGINVSPNFEGDVKNVNSLLKDFINKGRYKFNNQANIDQFYSDVENILIPSLPENFITKRFIRPSGRVLGTKQARATEIIVDGKKTTIDDYYKRKMNDMFGPKRGDGYATDQQRAKKGLKPLKPGKPFTGKAQEFKARKYGDVFGNSAKSFEKANKEGKIKEFNDINESMHRQLWQRINKSIGENKENARVWGNYFSTVSLITEHPHRLGAEFVGWSPKPKGFDGKLYEWEHAMPASQSYLYLLESILDPNFNFELSYQLVMDNYKLVALDNYVDKTSIKNAGRTTSMGEGWNMIDGIWLDRYFKGNIDIDARTIVGLDGRTFEDIYSIPRLKTSVSKTKVLNKAIQFSRSANNPTKGITVLDFDDTLATTKSGVRAKIPNTDGLPKPKRKVIFLAGGAGSGKGNVISKLNLEEQGFKIVNSDISLEWLKKNNGLPENMNDLTKEQRSKLGSLQHQARGIAKRKMIKYKGNADGVVVDGTGGSIKSMEKLVNEFKDKGYDVSMLFVETSLPVALERNAARKERSLLDKIVTRNHESVQGNKDDFKEMFGDRFMEVNTDNLSQQDAMPAKLTGEMNDFVSSYENRRLDAEEFASEGADILEQGGTFDFSEFNKVVEGQTAPLFEKAMKLQGKFGNKDMFVLTARPAESAQAIFEFLKANGLNIPLKNITGLANSTPEAKALWMADKAGEGYNDFYFADDALQNVQAVDNMLEQFDVKRKVQQAKVKFSKSMNDQFNDILENVTGIDSEKRFSIIKGRKRGESKGKFRYFIPPSHEDFVGLLYNFLGKGKEGNAHRDFFEQALIRPLNRANREYDTARQSVANDYKALNKQFKDVKEKLTKKTLDGDFTFQDAIRVYLWDKHGHKIPGLSETDQTKLAELVMSDPQLQAYAETLNVISKQEAYVNPTEGWNSGDIRMDLDDATGRIGRKEFFSEFIENADIIFSEENLNKIEAGYGKGVRESLEDMLYRIQTGRNRPSGQNEQVNKLMNYLNGSVGTVMFFNMRSALLQQMSIVNYINFADNNIFAAAKAFANQKQYWADWAFIFNSDMLKQRRGGIQTDVNGAELAASLRNSKNISRKLISKLLELGFLPTQIGDNIAIATGGATYYRNRINKYIKQGMSQKEAEAAAFTDFQDITQSTQQSARPDMVSKQQASVIGKVILNFQNVTSQFNRLGKKAFQDIYNRRITKPNTTQMQSDISNAARITYYFAVQNAIFYTLQTALFAMMFDDDEEDNNNLFLKKRERLINGSIDSVLRGTGLIGGVVATLKNVAIAFARQRDVKYNPDESAVMLEALNLSPVLGIKGRKIANAEKTLNYNKKVIKEMETFDIDNPQWSAATNYVEAFTNIPLNRLYNKTQNVRQSLNNDHAAWERTLMFLGWSQYNLDLENKKMEKIKEKTKSKKKKKKQGGIPNF